MVARIGIVLYLPSIALNAVTGIDIMTCIIVIGLITIVYCTMGGIEAVVWGDFIQGIVLVLGAILAAVWLTMGTEGGFSGFTELAGDAGKLRTFDWAFDIRQPCFWVILLGGFFTNVVTYTSDQSVVQRYLTTKDEAGARKSLWLNGILCVPVSIVFYSIGSALYTFYKTHPAELNVVMTQADQIFPHFMMTQLPIGIAGLLIAAVFSATMSTLSSNINSAATAFTTDFYRRFFHHNADDHQALRICRVATVIVGLAGMGMAWAVNLMQSQQIFVFFNMMAGLMLSGLGAFFAMGILTRFVTGGGALLGFTFNCFILYYIKQLDVINGWLYSLVGMVVTFVLSILFSFIFRGQKDLKNLTIYDLKNMESK
jgi:SSS family solute:Na+ symporter